MMPWAADSAIKVALVLFTAVAACPPLKRRSAAVRHWVLAAALAAAMTLPLITPMLPGWRPRIIGPDGSPAAVLSMISEPSKSSGTSPRPSTASPGPATDVMDWSRTLAVVWIGGSAMMALLLLLDLAHLRRYSSRARPLPDARLTAIAAQAAVEAGLRRQVRLAESPSPSLLATWGVFRPRLMVPPAARDWSNDRARVVFLHEMAHIRRLDWAMQLLAEGLRCVYWFDPLTWIAASRLRQESEHACDDAVLSGGVDGTDYAAHLLELARLTRSEGRPSRVAAAMARPSSLERRVAAMLDVRSRVAPNEWSKAAVLAAAVVFAAAIGTVDIVAQNFSTFSGSVVDPSNRVLTSATLVLTNVQNAAKHEVKSDATGRFEFVGLTPGSYTLDVFVPGFAVLHGNLTVSGERVQRDLTLEIGSLEETVTVVAHSTPPSPPSAPRPALPRRSNAGCMPSATGGVLRPPVKVKDVKPRYPDAMEATRAEGVVVMQAVIDKAGDLSAVEVTSSASPDFDAAAAEAVRQWQFDSTLLNCEPVDVHMRVTVSFKYQR